MTPTLVCSKRELFSPQGTLQSSLFLLRAWCKPKISVQQTTWRVSVFFEMFSHKRTKMWLFCGQRTHARFHRPTILSQKPQEYEVLCRLSNPWNHPVAYFPTKIASKIKEMVEVSKRNAFYLFSDFGLWDLNSIKIVQCTGWALLDFVSRFYHLNEDADNISPKFTSNPSRITSLQPWTIMPRIILPSVASPTSDAIRLLFRLSQSCNLHDAKSAIWRLHQSLEKGYASLGRDHLITWPRVHSHLSPGNLTRSKSQRHWTDCNVLTKIVSFQTHPCKLATACVAYRTLNVRTGKCFCFWKLIWRAHGRHNPVTWQVAQGLPHWSHNLFCEPGMEMNREKVPRWSLRCNGIHDNRNLTESDLP